MKKHGLILVNAYAETIDTRQVSRYAEEFRARGVRIDVRRNDYFPLSVIGGKIEKTQDYDFCLYLDKDKYVAALLEKSGVRLFNSAKSIAICDDKMLTHIELANNDVPMPDTLPGPLCYYPDAKIKSAALDTAEKRLGYPMIVKQSYGSFGKGVFKADNRTELERIASEIKLEPHLYQKYIAASHGKDMRVIVVGGKTLGGIMRMSDTDFRSNIGLGGHAVKTVVPPEISELAEKTAAVIGLDYCGIDFLLAPEPLVCEVNSNALFDAFEEQTGINVAGAFVEHILSAI